MSRHYNVWLLAFLLATCAPIQTVVQQRPSVELGPNFTGDDPWQVLAQLRTLVPKVDKYTSSEEKARLYQSVGPLRTLKFVRSCSKDYKVESQAWEIRLSPSGRASRETLNLVSQDKNHDMYGASNALGARTTVVKVETEKIDIGWRQEVDGPAFATGRPGFWFYRFLVRMSSSEARQVEQDIGCLIVFQPTPPFLDTYSESSTPTLSAPIDRTWRGTVITGKFLELWVFNKRT